MLKIKTAIVGLFSLFILCSPNAQAGTSVTFNGTTYTIPAPGELNWGSLSNFLIDVGQHAGLSEEARQAIRVATTSPVNVNATNDYAVVTDLTVPGAVSVALPTGVHGQIFVVVDGKGDGGTNNITITPAAGTIDNHFSYVMSHNGEAVTVQYHSPSGDWKVISKYIPSGAGAVTNTDVAANAAIDRSKLAAGTADHVVINAGDGTFSSEATLAKSRGGSAQDNSLLSFPASGTLATQAGSETLTNKTISGADNTLSNIDWTSVSKTGSNLTDLVTRDHTALTSVGSNTHSQIDTKIADIEDSIQKQEFTGFYSWSAAGPYYSRTGASFTLLVGGTGYVKGTKVTWTGGQAVNITTPNAVTTLFINAAGVLQTTTTPNETTYTDNIILAEALYDGSNYYIVAETHSYNFPTRTSRWIHNNLGTLIRGTGAVVTRVATGTGGAAGDRQIKIVGAAVLEDHGNEVTIPDSSGSGVSWEFYYTNASGKWVRQGQGTGVPMVYNNAGTTTALGTGPNGDTTVLTLYASKNDLNGTTPTYFAVINNAVYDTVTAAQTAITNNTIVRATNELAELELAQLGYAIIVNNGTSGYIDTLTVAKSTVSSQYAAGGASTSNLISNTTSSFNRVLSASDSTVQAALDTIDDNAITATTTDTLSNKTLSSPSITTPTITVPTVAQTTTPANPAAGNNKIYPKSDDKWYTLSSGGVETELGSGGGSGSGEKNYITNPSMATATTGWTCVGDLVRARTTTAAELPRENTTATGIKITANSGTQSTADYCYFDFSLDDVDIGRVLKVAFDQKKLATYAEGQLAVVITTQADRTTALYTPTVSAIPASDGTFGATFVTSTATATLSIVVRATGDMTTDDGITISDVVVGPGSLVQGTPVTDWVKYTPTLTGFGTPTGVNVWSRRVGDNLQLRGYFTTGTVSASAASISLGFGGVDGNVTVDTNKCGGGMVGKVGGTATAATFFDIGLIFNSVTPGILLFSTQSSTTALTSGRVGQDVAGSGQTVTLFAEVPISGWSSGVYLASGADNAAALNPTAYTPSDTTGFGTITENTLAYWRVGANMRVRGRFTTGTTGATEGRIAIPTGYTFGSLAGENPVVVGRWYRNNAQVAGAKGGPLVAIEGGTYVRISLDSKDTAESPFVPITGVSTYVGNSEIVGFDFEVPISGWTAQDYLGKMLTGFATATHTTVGLRKDEKQYVAGTTYNGVALTVTGTSNWVTGRAIFVPYQTSDGTYRLKFNIVGAVDSGSRSSYSVTIAGVKFKNVANYYQGIAGGSDSVANGQGFCYTGPNSGGVVCAHATAITTTRYSFSGDVELETYPTWMER